MFALFAGMRGLHNRIPPKPRPHLGQDALGLQQLLVEIVGDLAGGEPMPARTALLTPPNGGIKGGPRFNRGEFHRTTLGARQLLAPFCFSWHYR